MRRLQACNVMFAISIGFVKMEKKKKMCQLLGSDLHPPTYHWNCSIMMPLPRKTSAIVPGNSNYAN